MSFNQWLHEHYEEVGPFRWLAFALELLSALTLFGLMALTCVDVSGRYLINNPVMGATEMTQIGLAIMVFSAMPVLTWRGGHIVVDLLDHMLGERIVRLLTLFSALVISSSLYFVAVRIFELAQRSMKRGVVTEYLGIPVGYIVEYIAIFSWITAFGLITYGAYRVIVKGKV